jgi:transcriptional regulator with XRE-family HTH domain
MPATTRAAATEGPGWGFAGRLKAARLAAGLTQTELAGERYTKALISALEHGASRPSVASLDYLAARLGLSPAALLEPGETPWARLEADLRLAAGDWVAAADAYGALLADEIAPLRRAELLRGLAEACASLDQGERAVSAAAEAATIFETHGLPLEAIEARYWQAAGLYRQENAEEARSLLRHVLDAIRSGSRVQPDFEVRVLIAVAMIDGREGHHARALTYLDEARGRLGELDDRRRASFLESLAISYREAGDYEGALTLGRQALTYFRAAANELESAVLDNELALTYLALGNLRRARAHAAAAAKQLTAAGDRAIAANVAETRAAIALAGGDLVTAAQDATRAAELARETGNAKALISATLTAGRIARRQGDLLAARAQVEVALATAREHARAAQVRECLVELSDLAAAGGDTARAYALAREALG